MTYGLGIEHDWGGSDGVEGDIDVPIPLSKGVAYRFPFSGKIYYDRDNLTITYGHNINQIDPFNSLFDYQKHRDPRIAIPRDLPWKPNVPTRAKRQVQVEIINNESNSVPVHPETAAKGQIDAIVRHLQDPPPNVEAHPRVKPLAVAPPGPAPIPLPPDTSTNVQPFYPIGRDTSADTRIFQNSPLIEDGRFDLPPLIAGPPPNPEEVLRKLNPQIFLKDHEANNQEIVRQLMAINQQPVQPILDPYLKLRVERPNLLQQVLERQVQQNALLEEEINQQLRQLNLGPLNLNAVPATTLLQLWKNLNITSGTWQNLSTSADHKSHYFRSTTTRNVMLRHSLLVLAFIAVAASLECYTHTGDVEQKTRAMCSLDHPRCYVLVNNTSGQAERACYTEEDCAAREKQGRGQCCATSLCNLVPIVQHEAPAPTSVINKLSPVIVFIYLATVSLIGAMIFIA
ncbi:unnamed protein product, partial [Mesorhabditis spiculigera]